MKTAGFSRLSRDRRTFVNPLWPVAAMWPISDPSTIRPHGQPVGREPLRQTAGGGRVRIGLPQASQDSVPGNSIRASTLGSVGFSQIVTLE